MFGEIKTKIKQCQVIWVFGESGAGKTVWTDKYLNSWKELKINDEVAFIGTNNMVNDEKILFSVNHERCRVLVMNEVDQEFPKHNNLINFIDRKECLLTRQNKEIQNNFELIIVNSILRPERVFASPPVDKYKAVQVLRRIYNVHLDCVVYEIKANKKQLKEIEKGKIKFVDNEEFQNWYKPKVIQHKKLDYSSLNKSNSTN